MKTADCICLMGVDGSGKTTLANACLDYLKTKNIKTTHIWSRYRNYLSKPFLGLMRLTGHNRKEVINGVKIGYHDFAGSALISYCFLLLQWIDQVIDITLRFRTPKNVIVSDRCIVDTLVDLCIDTGRDDFILDKYGKSLMSLMPASTKYMIIFRDKEAVFTSRPDVMADQNYLRRIELYKMVASKFSLRIIDNNQSITESLNKIITEITKPV